METVIFKTTYGIVVVDEHDEIVASGWNDDHDYFVWFEMGKVLNVMMKNFY